MIIKQLPEDEKYVSIYNCDTAFKNEIIAYDRIIPHLNSYSSRPLSTSQCMYTRRDYIVLYDLSELGFESIEKLDGFNDVSMAKNVLRELANFHSASLIMQLKNKRLFDELLLTNALTDYFQVKYSSKFDIDAQDRNIETALEIMIEEDHHSASLERGRVEAAVEVLNNLSKGQSSLQQIDLLKQHGKLPVFNHGDLRSGNILINRTTNEFKLIDFQVMRYASIAADLNYFFYVNFNPKFRIDNQTDLLAYYLDELKLNIRKCDCADLLENELTMDWLCGEMRTFALFGFLAALWILPVLFWDIERPVKTEQEFSELPMLIELDLLPAAYKERVRDLVISFVENP